MKTLKETAANFNLYQECDIPERFKKYNYEHKLSLAKGQTIPEFLKNSDLLEIGLFYECRVQDAGTKDELFYIENNFILLKGKNSETLLMLRGNDYHNKDKYWFTPYYGETRKFDKIHYDKRSKVVKMLTEPNKIGVFTDKKVIAWLEYCDLYMVSLNHLLESVNGENTKIEQQIQDFRNSLPKGKYQTYKDTTYITTPLFEVVFKHDRESHYLSTNITFKGTLDDIVRIES